MAKTVIVKGFPEELHYRAKVQAAKEQVTLKELFVRAVAEYLKKADRKGGDR